MFSSTQLLQGGDGPESDLCRPAHRLASRSQTAHLGPKVLDRTAPKHLSSIYNSSSTTSVSKEKCVSHCSISISHHHHPWEAAFPGPPRQPPHTHGGRSPQLSFQESSTPPSHQHSMEKGCVPGSTSVGEASHWHRELDHQGPKAQISASAWTRNLHALTLRAHMAVVSDQNRFRRKGPWHASSRT